MPAIPLEHCLRGVGNTNGCVIFKRAG